MKKRQPIRVAILFTLEELDKLKAIAPRWMSRRVSAALKTAREKEKADAERRERERRYMAEYMREYRAKKKADEDDSGAQKKRPRRLADEPAASKGRATSRA